jgi:GH15 family glucan-1,4-alpha-glucosidase
MPDRIEDYGFVSDLQTSALVSRSGSVDWLSFPRFDSPACFSALLGDISRRYRDETLVLETEHRTAEGTVRVLDFMPQRGRHPDLVRIVEGVGGRVAMRMQLIIRFDYGLIVPWVRKADGSLLAVAGPDALCLRTPVETRGEELTTVAEFTVEEGDRVPFVLTWFPSHYRLPPEVDAFRALEETVAFWRSWCSSCAYEGPYREAVLRSLITLKGMIYEPTGGIVAAATTSLPEQLGGVRNWDYRYCWVRDSTYTLHALIDGGYVEEARHWRDWLLRAVAGDAADLQIMYGAAGERRLTEFEVPWLPGYEGSKPVRIGNAASEQFQLDVYGEIVDTLYEAYLHGMAPDEHGISVQLKLLQFLESAWRKPDDSLWEIRGEPRHFTHSKVMAWVAFDRAVKIAEREGISGPLVQRFRRVRDEIHAEVLERGFDRERNTFVQSYASDSLDASLLLIPIVGFLPPRVAGTVRAIERRLTDDCLVQRYEQAHGPAVDDVDGLPPGEGAFLFCSFWLADALVLMGEVERAQALYGQLLGLRNDLGLLAEEYDSGAGRLLGNFPQAFSHVGVVATAFALARAERGEKKHRGRSHQD